MKKEKINDLLIQDARIIFRNFSGKEGPYNRKGERSFSVIIDDPNAAKALTKDGWLVKVLEPREEGDEPIYYIQVSVRFDVVPPQVFVITDKSHVKTRLNEDTIQDLDYAEIINADMTLNPYIWEVNGKSGIKAYLKSLYVTIKEDILAEKYADFDSPEDR